MTRPKSAGGASGGEFAGIVGTCRCGKVSYSTKKWAKRAARRVPVRRGGHLNAYRCGNYWHIGHLPRSVVKGKLERSKILEYHPDPAKRRRAT